MHGYVLLRLLALSLCLSLLAACAPARPAPKASAAKAPAQKSARAEGTGRPDVPATAMSAEDVRDMMVAPFTQAHKDADLLFGDIPPGGETVPANTLRGLDADFAGMLSASGKRAYGGQSAVADCMERTPAKGRALDRWVEVAQCAGARHLLAPQIAYWVERQGGAMGSQRPASVVVDFFIVDVKEHSIVGHTRFEETQVALSSNLLTVDKFLARGGQFVLAGDLAREGMKAAIQRMGL